MAFGIGATAEFVQACATERAVCGVPPDEVGYGCSRGKQQTQREKNKSQSSSHGQPQYSIGTLDGEDGRQAGVDGRRFSSRAAKTTRPLYVPQTGQT